MALAQTFDCQRILSTDIDIAFGGANGVGSDHHAFDYRMWIALNDGAIHVGPWVAFIGIADKVLQVTRRTAAKLPLQSGWGSRLRRAP